MQACVKKARTLVTRQNHVVIWIAGVRLDSEMMIELMINNPPTGAKLEKGEDAQEMRLKRRRLLLELFSDCKYWVGVAEMSAS